VPEVVAGLARPGDLVLTMGAGDVTVLGAEILIELGRREQARGEQARPERAR
jgi:UDP-N-acetylmuramate--alanine ligase